MYLKIKNSRLLKGVSVFCALNFIGQVFYPTAVYALTSGPSQPEIQSFEPVSTSQMVNLSTGDFAYNIPLLTVPGPNGGYPINMSYHAGIGMEQEASWVGLGWNINPGSVNRSVRGLPDDFNGAKVKKEYYTEPVYHRTLGLTGGTEAFAADFMKGQVGLNLHSNSRTGLGVSFSMSVDYMALGQANPGVGHSLGFDYNPNSGVGLTYGAIFDAVYLKSRKSFYYTKHGLQSTSINFSADLSLKNDGDLKTIHTGTITRPDGLKQHTFGYKQLRDQKLGFSVGGASTRHYGKGAFVPHSTFPTNTESNSIFGGYGSLSVGIFGSAQFMFTDTKTSLITNEKAFDAYGYMYSENADDESLLDFTRENDGPLPHTLKNLPMPVFSNDVFQASAQGMISAFRPYRSDVGVLHDPLLKNSGNVGHMSGGELALGDGFQAGVDHTESYIEYQSGKWSNMDPSEPNQTDDFNSKYKFYKKDDLIVDETSNQTDGSLYEPFYMRSTADVVANSSEVDYLNSEAPAPFIISGSNGSPEIGGSIYSTNRKRRAKRVQSTLIRTLNDLKNAPEQGAYDILQHHPAVNYDELAAQYPDANVMDQIAELTVYNAQGMRYVYGLPAYNSVKKDVIFSVDNPNKLTPGSGDGPDSNNRLYDYTPEDHVKKANGKGIDEYFSRNTTPAYAYTHFLTAVYSSDYVDLTGNGPTEDDLGYYVKYDYDKVTDNFKWRAPFYDANYMRGDLSNYADDKASYSYGEKEIYVLKSIETKTHIAHFITSTRNDGFGVESEHQESDLTGDENLIGQRKLDRIDLYSKRDANYNPNTADQTIPPIKSVHFKYDYSLCQSVDNFIPVTPTENGENGKLTLKKVFFTYGNSTRGALSPYQFSYGNGGEFNPHYDINDMMDRWGNYQGAPTFGTNRDHMYVDQHEKQDPYRDGAATSWNLTKIKLPSGAEMNIEYEQDDYAYVQDRKALQMMKIVGVGDENGIQSSGTLNTNMYVYFALDKDPELQPVTGMSTAQLGEKMAQDYLKDLDLVYFKAYMRMKDAPGDWSGDTPIDYVEGYVEKDPAGTIGYTRHNGEAVGYFKVKGVSIADYTDKHPFQKAAIQKIKLQRPDLLVAPEYNDSFVEAIGDIKNFFTDWWEFIDGYYSFAFQNNYGDKIVISDAYPSMVRLNTEDGIKHGGGHRVKRLTLNDQWNAMTGTQDSFDYGQEYTYRLPDGTSSGVATYEPVIGNEENAFHMPDFDNPEDFIVSDDAAYRDTPVGEQYFPAASVGYSRIVVNNIVRDEEKSDTGERLTTSTGMGKVVHEFYTAKDFPVRLEKSVLKNKIKRTEEVFPFVGYKTFDNRAYSQAMTLHLNDMHGKPKSKATYPETAILFQKNQEDPTAVYNEAPFSSKDSYYYDTEQEYSASLEENKLDNKVKLLYPDGKVKQDYLGRTIEFFTDTRESFTKQTKQGTQVDFGLTTVGLAKVPIFTFNMAIDAATENKFRSIVSNKIVAKNGILTKVVSNKAGVETTVEHLLFDAETGSPLLSRAKNEFDRSIYSYSYPAHRYYEGMSGAYKNLEATYSTKQYQLLPNYNSIDNVLQFEYILEHSGEILYPGDEVALTTSNGGNYAYWVIEIDKVYEEGVGNRRKVRMASKLGDIVLPAADGINELSMKVVRSGRRNHMGTSVGNKTYMEGAHKLTELLNLHLAGPILSINPTVPVFSNQHLVDCDNKALGVVNMSTENPHTFSFYISNQTNGEPDSEKAYVTLPSEYNFLTAPFNNLGNYKFIKEDETMHIEVANGGGTPIYIEAKWEDPYDVFPACELILQAGAVEFSEGDWDIPYEELPSKIVSPNMAINHKNANAYNYGKAGVWRAKKSYAYLTDRVQLPQMGSVSSTNIAKDGYYEEFNEFDWSKTEQEDLNWRWTAEATKFSPYGFELESKNALEQYSAALYGYDGALATAVGANTKYNELAYTGFEDIDASDIISEGSGAYMTNGHLKFESNAPLVLTTEESHTGKYSLKYDPYHYDCAGGDDIYAYFIPNGSNEGLFIPETSKTYILSAWLKVNPANDMNDEETHLAKVAVQKEVGGNYTNIAESNTYYSELPWIEGWKRLQLKFTVEDIENQSYRIKISGKSCSGPLQFDPVYIDDLRIYPADGAMTSYVYDRDNLRLKAELDGQNFATFYDYDDAGALIQVKKETADGIKTLQTSRSNAYKINSVE